MVPSRKKRACHESDSSIMRRVLARSRCARSVEVVLEHGLVVRMRAIVDNL